MTIRPLDASMRRALKSLTSRLIPRVKRHPAGDPVADLELHRLRSRLLALAERCKPQHRVIIDTDGRRRSSVKCPQCGGTIWLSRRGGRPRDSCSTDICGQLAKRMREIESLMWRVQERASLNGEEGRRALARLRGDLWRIGNLSNAAGAMVEVEPGYSDGRDRSGWRGLNASPTKEGSL